jgi:hypothetical protein
VILAANRDERLDRPWDPPGAHWPQWPGVYAGRDRSAGGTWMGVNQSGVTAAVLNRQGSLGPAPGKRSRGELPLLALTHGSAGEAVAAISALDAGEWRSFNLVIADRGEWFFIRGLGSGRPQVRPLAEGIHMVTAHDPNDEASPRVARHLPRFRSAPEPKPGEWRAWADILADQSGPAGSEINVPGRAGFGTVCSSLLGLPASGGPVWLFAAGPPDAVPFCAVRLPSHE